jgi:putative protein kinase ArgK-like GTPase of G3E family
MGQLAVDPRAFVRPSPSSGTLGGVTAKTRETMLLCEAAGYDVVMVETVGIGQSETAVADMTDFFLVLMLPGAGDELQGLKKGALELADIVAVNKADGDNIPRAKAAAAEYRAALNILTPQSAPEYHRSSPIRHLLVVASTNCGLRFSHTKKNDGVERIGDAASRATGEMDVDDAGERLSARLRRCIGTHGDVGRGSGRRRASSRRHLQLRKSCGCLASR